MATSFTGLGSDSVGVVWFQISGSRQSTQYTCYVPGIIQYKSKGSQICFGQVLDPEASFSSDSYFSLYYGLKSLSFQIVEEKN